MLNYNSEQALARGERRRSNVFRLLRDVSHSKLRLAGSLTGIALGLAAFACSTALPPPDNAAALHDIAAGHAGAEVVVEGTVTSVLPTTAGPSGVHERFIMSVRSDGTSLPLFVADNISVGSAAPLYRGDHVIVKGELAFNSLGPVIHWTHRDPRMRHAPGFVEVGGHVYE